MTIFTYEEDRKALITGGASGFGLATAKRLVQAGVRVAIVDVNADALKSASEQLGPSVVGVQMDVTDQSSVEQGVRDAAAELGGLDMLVTSAGVFTFGELTQIEESEWDTTIDVNLKGTFLALRAALPFLRESGRGRVVTISSTSGVRGDDNASHYSASKWGVIGLTQSAAVENGRYGVTCNVVCPGVVPGTSIGQRSMDQKVSMRGQSAQEIVQRDGAVLPMRRLGEPEDIADAVMFLLSDNAGWITGQAIVVDGGALLAPPSQPA